VASAITVRHCRVAVRREGDRDVCQLALDRPSNAVNANPTSPGNRPVCRLIQHLARCRGASAIRALFC